MRQVSGVPGVRELLALAWPLIASRATQAVIGFADAAMAGQLGEDALAATTTGAIDAFALFILPMGTVFIVASFTSQLAGRGEPRSARRFGVYGLLVALATEIVGVALIPLLVPTLGLLDYQPAVERLLVDYLAIRLLSGGAVVGLEALANYYGGLGNTRLPMAANVLAMLLNVPLNWVLIYGRLGAPAMGVAGAALASVIASSVAFLLLLGCFLAGLGAPGGRARSPLRARELWRVLRFGLPNGLNWFFEFLAFAFFVNVVVAGLGTTSLAAMMSVLQVNSVAFMPAFGLASAGAILVGQEIGARRHDAVPGVLLRTLAFAAGWQALAGVAYLVLAPEIMTLFAPAGQGHALVAAGVPILQLSAAWQLFDASASVLSEALRAAGDTVFCLVARLAIAWLLFVPGSLVTVTWLRGGALVATGWLVGYLGVLAATLAWRFVGGAWRRIDLVGEPEPTV